MCQKKSVHCQHPFSCTNLNFRKSDSSLEELAELALETHIAHLPASSDTLDEFRGAQDSDHFLTCIKGYFTNGWPAGLINLAQNQYYCPTGKCEVSWHCMRTACCVVAVLLSPSHWGNRPWWNYTPVTRESNGADSKPTPQCGGLDFHDRSQTLWNMSRVCKGDYSQQRATHPNTFAWISSNAGVGDFDGLGMEHGEGKGVLPLGNCSVWMAVILFFFPINSMLYTGARMWSMKRKMPQFLHCFVKCWCRGLWCGEWRGQRCVTLHKLRCLNGSNTFLFSEKCFIQEHMAHLSHHWALPGKPSFAWLSSNPLFAHQLQQPIKAMPHVTHFQSHHTITVSTNNLATWFSNDPVGHRLLTQSLGMVNLHY